MATSHPFMNTLGAAIAEIKAIVEAESFLDNAARLKNITPAQKNLLESVGAVYAAANFLAKEDIASPFQVSFNPSKDSAGAGPRNPGPSSGPVARDAVSADCCLMWQWDPIRKTLVCVKSC
jgi:hypothetical protein